MHRVVHIEFAAEDPKALSEFYRELFGWRTMPSDLDDTYVVWSHGEGDQEQAGGFRKFQPDESRTPSERVMLYIEVADIPAALARIEGLGGATKLGKTPIGGHGFIACFTDPAGNSAGLWSRPE
jgi:predicted enzyme related to lactoylglutathione lyase